MVEKKVGVSRPVAERLPDTHRNCSAEYMTYQGKVKQSIKKMSEGFVPVYVNSVESHASIMSLRCMVNGGFFLRNIHNKFTYTKHSTKALELDY